MLENVYNGLGFTLLPFLQKFFKKVRLMKRKSQIEYKADKERVHDQKINSTGMV